MIRSELKEYILAHRQKEETWEVGKSDLLIDAPLSSHYKVMGIEPIQYIEANGIGFHEGNIIKYVSRWQHKDGVEDLKKAKFYIERLIELAKGDMRVKEKGNIPLQLPKIEDDRLLIPIEEWNVKYNDTLTLLSDTCDEKRKET